MKTTFPDIVVGNSERRVSYSVDGIGYPSEDEWVEATKFPFPQNDGNVEAATEIELVTRRKQLQNRISGSGIFYYVEIPLSTSGEKIYPQTTTFGFNLAQIARGRILSAYELDLDSLNFQLMPTPSEILAEDSDPRVQRERLEKTNPHFLADLDINQSGLVVTSVIKGSDAWNAGVRPGDFMLAVSATMGDSLWPKSSLEGVKSAICSRRIAFGGQTIKFEMKKFSAVSKEKETQFELTLNRPLGFNIRESVDESGYVEVSSVSENATNLVKFGIQVGDRIVAIESSIGDQMWPASSTVEGVISACTGRLPGQPLKIRFERSEPKTHELQQIDGKLLSRVDLSDVAVAPKETTSEKQVIETKELLSRCRSVLRRYAIDDISKKQEQRQLLASYSSIVADKVVDAIASASCEVDSRTLHMIMNAYLSGDQPEKAIQVFEAATGFAGDGSIERSPAIIHGRSSTARIIPTESAMNLYTCTALLRAHSALGDLSSVRRVLLAMEGRSGETIGDGIESAPWPWTGSLGSLRPDTVCYNIGISCAAKTGGTEALQVAMAYFRTNMESPDCKEIEQQRPIQNLVTFNTLINALCSEGLYGEAFTTFEEMKRKGLKPDKFTYTPLLKACSNDVDVEELVYDMKEHGVQADVVTYNTIIKLLCQKRKWTQASRLISEMESNGIFPDSRTYSLIMSEMLKEGKASSCLTLFESACSSRSTAVLTENIYMYTIAITAAAKLGDHQRALEYVARMNANGIKPNVQALTAVMGACLAPPNPMPDLAVQVFRRMEQPDAYAISQGIRALCEAGNLEEATRLMQSLKQGAGIRGKQIMYTYKHLLQSALMRSNYDVARTIFSDLLRNGYIPNEAIYHTIFGACGINATEKERIEAHRTQMAIPKFQFLLFVVDSLQRRKLPVAGDVFASVLALGQEIGGLPLRVALLFASKKTIKAETEIVGAKSNQPTQAIANTWEELFLKYDSYQKEDTVPQNLPNLVVRVAPRFAWRVLQAELSISENGRKRMLGKP